MAPTLFRPGPATERRKHPGQYGRRREYSGQGDCGPDQDKGAQPLQNRIGGVLVKQPIERRSKGADDGAGRHIGDQLAGLGRHQGACPVPEGCGASQGHGQCAADPPAHDDAMQRTDKSEDKAAQQGQGRQGKLPGEGNASYHGARARDGPCGRSNQGLSSICPCHGHNISFYKVIEISPKLGSRGHDWRADFHLGGWCPPGGSSPG